MIKSRVKEKIRRREPILCAATHFPHPALTEFIGQFGFDCLWVCTEHIATDKSTLENVIRAGRLTGMDIMVRVVRGNYDDLIQPLELGAKGLMIPRLRTPTEVERIVYDTKFYPLGRRGIDGATTLLRQTAAADDAVAVRLAQVHRRIIALHRMRAPLLQSYVLLCVVVFLAAAPVLWSISLGRSHLAIIWEYALLIVAAFPLAALLLALFPITGTGWALASVTVLTALLVWTTKALAKCRLDSFLLLFSATGLALLLDILTGAKLIQWSALGYDVIGGARFYGIGNEYGGVLLTSVLTAVGILLHRSPVRSCTRQAIAAFLLTSCIAGAPWWGANNGVAASAVLGFTLTTFFLLQAPVSWRHILAAGLLLLLFAAAAIALELTWNKNNPSHLGQLARQVMAGGLAPIWSMAARKLAMNLKLLRYTIWTKVLLSSLAISSALIFRPVPWVRDFLARSPQLLAVAKGSLVTAMFLLVLNDSGVVAAATAMIPVTTLLLFLAARSLAMKRVTTK
jgi:hypothetical protein